MSDLIHREALHHIQQQLSKPAVPMIHALIFGIVASVSGFLSSISSGYVYGIDNLIYVGIMLWSGILFVHSQYAYRRSAANKTRRENVIQEQLLRLANEYDLSTDELADLHEHLSNELRQQAEPFAPLLISTGSYVALWIGAMAVGVIIAMFRGMTAESMGLITQGIPLISTYLITLQLIAGFVLRHGKVEDRDMRTASLRAIYTTKVEKRKRLASEPLTIDDDGEIALEKIEKRSIRSNEG